MSSWQGPVVLRQDTGACCGRDRLRAPTAQTPRRYAVGNLDPGMLCRPSPDVEGVNAWRSWGGNGPSSIGRKVLCLWHLRRNRAWAMASGTRLRRVRVGHCCEPVGPIGQKPAGAMDHPAQVLAAGRRRLLRAAAGPDSSEPRFGATLTLATAGQVELRQYLRRCHWPVGRASAACRARPSLSARPHLGESRPPVCGRSRPESRPEELLGGRVRTGFGRVIELGDCAGLSQLAAG